MYRSVRWRFATTRSVSLHTHILAACLIGVSLLTSPRTLADNATPDMLPGGFPPFETPLPDSSADWDARKPALRRALWRLLGDLPPLFTPEAEILDRQARDGYTFEHFAFDNRAGDTVYGYLLIPAKPQGRLPAVLYHHCHTSHDRVGKEELIQPSKRCAGGVSPGEDLVRHGYIVLCIDAYTFSERRYDGPGGKDENGNQTEESLFKMFLWQGRTLWGMIVRDDLLALNYLLSRPEVDPAHVAAIGFSMGSTRSWWAAALDDRIKAVVSIACLTRYQNLIAHAGLKFHSIYYFVPGLLKEKIDTETVVGLIAPRPHLTLTGDRDDGSPADGVRIINDFESRLYNLYNKPGQYRGVLVPDTPHACTPEMWQETLKWLDRWLH